MLNRSIVCQLLQYPRDLIIDVLVTMFDQYQARARKYSYVYSVFR